MSDLTFCCFPIDIAVRLIGSINLLTYTLIFIVLAFYSDEVSSDGKIKVIFGLESKLFFSDSSDVVGWFTILYLVYTLVAAVSSALLIWASIIAQRWLTVPWLVCSFIKIFCHLASLILLSVTSFSFEDKWLIALTVFYIVAILYFMIVVVAAIYIWRIESKELFTYKNQEVWENVYKSPPLFKSPYKNQV